MRKFMYFLCIMVMSSGLTVSAQTENAARDTTERRLYLVSTSHLDTQWRWTIKTTIDEFIPATFRDNFALMDIFPNYTFSFEGAFRYMLLKEYYPEEYERLKSYIDDGRWRVAGSWVDAVDVNIPSPESLIRQVLYGNGFFRREFGQTSRDILLPDCFGFGYALPSIAAHCGLESFSTQKLTWGSAVGVPFDIGMWEGVDGSSLIAAINPGAYVSQIREDLSRDSAWLETINHQGEISGLYAGFKYFGTGDTGGAPDSESVAWAETSMAGDGPISVRNIGSDDLVDIISPAQRDNLPRYKGELVMTRHGVGCYTSQAAMKRWNRKNELLADAAERASVIADWLGGMEYPRESLRENWVRFLWHQFHDDLTGTSIPEAYEYSWNDEILCLNQFAGILESAVEAAAPALDTRVEGVPLIVYNPLSISRKDVVEATVVFDGDVPRAVEVYDPAGKEVPSQIARTRGDSLTVVFLANVPSVGYAVYDVRPARNPCTMNTGLKVTTTGLENERYTVQLDVNGDVTSIFDKAEQRELLAGPIQLQMLYNKPDRWAAWEIDYGEIMAEPQAVVGGKAEIDIVDSGPARVGLAVTRRHGRSIFRQFIHLAAGEAGNRVLVDNKIDWYERETLLKAAFTLADGNDHVTYDLGLGSIERGINHPELYEVPGQQWADMTAEDGGYGTAILNDCKYGWDHPDKQMLRLTLIHTPGVPENWSWIKDQQSQDNGQHEFTYAVYGHHGDWREGAVQWSAARLNQPLLAFQSTEHEGELGKTFSLLRIGAADSRGAPPSPQIAVNAVKYAENNNEIVIRLQELFGKPADNVQVHFSEPIAAAHEINGAEQALGEVEIKNGALELSFIPYQPRAFALALNKNEVKPLRMFSSEPLLLPFDVDGISLDAGRLDGDFDGAGNSLSGDLLPDTLIERGVPFVFGPTAAGLANVVSCRGQMLTLPRGEDQRLYLVAAATSGPALGIFTVGGQEHAAWVHDYAEPRGKWNSRMVGQGFVEKPEDITPAHINRTPVAWTGTHRHNADGENEAYLLTYLDLIELPIPRGAEAVVLPDNQQIKLLAATAVQPHRDRVRAAQPLYDVADAVFARILAERNTFIDVLDVRMGCHFPDTEIRYTLDGSDPDAGSPLYAGPITISATTTVKSRAFRDGSDDRHVTTREFEKLALRDPTPINNLAPGLSCSYYEGEWSKLPDFDTVAVQKEIVMDSIAIPEFARDEDYGLVFTGYVQIPRDGLYDFFITSDDGSALYVDDLLLADNDGLHGAYEIAGELALRAGMYPIAVRMFQSKGGETLEVALRGSEFAKRPLTPAMLFHAIEGKTR